MTTAAYGPAVLQAGRDLGITPKGIVIGFATVFVGIRVEELCEHQSA